MALPTVTGVGAMAGGYVAHSIGLDKAMLPILAVVGSMKNMIQGTTKLTQRLLDRQTTTIEDTAQISDNSDLQINLLQEILEVNRAQYSFMVASASKAARTRAQQMLDDIEARREAATIGDTDDDISAAPSRQGRGLLGRLGSLFQGNILEFLGLTALLRFFTNLRKRLLPMTKAFGKIFFAVTAIYNFIDGFNEEFDPEKQNWGQAGVAGIAKVVKGILAIPAKIGKWAVENILRTFGFKETADQVKNWDEDQWLDNLIATYYKRDGEFVTLGNFITRAIAMPAELGRWVAKQALMAFGYTQEEADKYLGSGNIGDALYDMLPDAASVGPAVVKFFKEDIPRYATDISNWFYTSEEDLGKPGHFQLFGMEIPTWSTMKMAIGTKYNEAMLDIGDFGKYLSKQAKDLANWIYTPGDIDESGQSLTGPKLFGIQLPTWAAIKKQLVNIIQPAADLGKRIAQPLMDIYEQITSWFERQFDEIANALRDTALGRLIFGDDIVVTPEDIKRQEAQQQASEFADTGILRNNYVVKEVLEKNFSGLVPDRKEMLQTPKNLYDPHGLGGYVSMGNQINIVNGGSTINNLGVGGNNGGGGSNRTPAGSSRTPVPASGWAYDGKYGAI